ncbi:probable disease resistance protein RXW24L isoform X1 [Typha angustifolia]|uniref:probable disease resistance protein RXW24L isoform X1 n=1 Tax=Typha angustifolia TaxID=59011 RepID=UPI003C2C673B
MVDVIVSHLVFKLAKPIVQHISFLCGVRDQVDSLLAELRAIESFLKDMSTFRPLPDERTKNWVREVRNVAYEAEDIVENFMLEVNPYTPPRRPLKHHKIAKDIVRVLSKIREISDRRSRYSATTTLDERGGEGTSRTTSNIWRRSSPHLGDDVIIGLEEDANSMLQRLLAPSGRREVIAITGMGGSGKTTLATMVYNRAPKIILPSQGSTTLPKEDNTNGRTENYFDACAWVSVNQDPDVGNLLWEMMVQVGFPVSLILWSNELTSSEGRDAWIRRQFVEMLFPFLLRKRYLIVLDDVWRNEVWDQIKVAFPNSGNESRVILTTRSMEVANYVDTSFNPYVARLLNDEESWELFRSKVFRASNIEARAACPPELEDLGRCLSKRCGGLPLALVVLGSLLSGKDKHPVIWSNLINNLSWESSDVGRQCLEILSLSYHDLPYYIKSCFLYLGSFRQGSDICVSKLIEWWIVDDLIVEQKGKMTKLTAVDYLEELIQRSLVQVRKRGSDKWPKRIRVHDLIGDLSRLEARESRFFETIDPTSLNAEQEPESWKITYRRLALHVDDLKFPNPNYTKRLRTLLVFPKNRNYQIVGGNGNGYKPVRRRRRILKMVPHLCKISTSNTLPNTSMKYLRVLELEGLRGGLLLPEDSMIHLRYLGLRDSELTHLPISVGNLQYLQTLDIRGTSIELPKEFWMLRMLQHLYLNRISPPRLRGLRNLQTLHQVVPGSWVEKDLPTLIYLQNLRIDGVSESYQSPLAGTIWELRHLSSIKLHGESIAHEMITSTHFFLYKLKLDGRMQPAQLPSWSEFPRYLTKLTLVCSRLETDPMPTLEKLPSLRTLKLKDDAYYGPLMVCSVDGFPKLQYLKLSKLSVVTSYVVHPGSLRSLTRLSIHSCPLEMLPEGLQYIETLKVLKLKDPHRALLLRVQEGQGEDWYKIRHVSSVVLCNSTQG